MKKIILTVVFFMFEINIILAQNCDQSMAKLFDYILFDNGITYKTEQERIMFTYYSNFSEILTTPYKDFTFYKVYYVVPIDTSNFFNKKKYYYIQANQLKSIMDRKLSIKLLKKSLILTPKDSSEASHNFAVYYYLGTEYFSQETPNFDTVYQYYLKADSVLKNNYSFIETNYNYDIVSFYYRYANFLLSMQPAETEKAKIYFNKCIALSEKFNYLDKKEKCEIILNSL